MLRELQLMFACAICRRRSLKRSMTDEERTTLEQEVTVFAVSWTTEVNELKRNYAADFNFEKNSQSNEFCNAIISYLLEVRRSWTTVI